MPASVPPPEECVSMHELLTELLKIAPKGLHPLVEKQVRVACSVALVGQGESGSVEWGHRGEHHRSVIRED